MWLCPNANSSASSYSRASAPHARLPRPASSLSNDSTVHFTGMYDDVG
jgi:hypothetical protein